MCVCVCVCVCVYTGICVYICMCVHVYVCACMYTYMYMCVHVCVCIKENFFNAQSVINTNYKPVIIHQCGPEKRISTKRSMEQISQ